MLLSKILPGTGRGTAPEGRGGGGPPRGISVWRAPSTKLRLVPLPVPGRICGATLLALLPIPALAAPDVTIDDSNVFPESIAADAAGNLYASSFKGVIYRAPARSTKAVAWIRPDDTNKLLWTLGVLPDERSNSLWVCSTPVGFLTPPRPGEAAVVAFDLKTGAFKARYPLPAPADGKPAAAVVCNDMAVGQYGKLYITDTGAGRLLSLAPNAKAVTVETADPLLVGVEGPAFSADNILYVNNTRQNSILRVNRKSDGSFESLTKLTTSIPLNGPDALRPYKGNSFLQAETGGKGRATLVTISGDHADVKILSDDTGGGAAITHIGDIFYTVPGKIQYLFDPSLKGKDPGAFVIKAMPIGGAQ